MFIIGQGSILTGFNILSRDFFLFSRIKAFDANIGTNGKYVEFVKTPNVFVKLTFFTSRIEKFFFSRLCLNKNDEIKK